MRSLPSRAGDPPAVVLRFAHFPALVVGQSPDSRGRPGLLRSGRRVGADGPAGQQTYCFRSGRLGWLMAAWAAARRATGTRYGEQET